MQRLLPPRLWLVCLCLTIGIGLLLPLSPTLPVLARLAGGPVAVLGCWLCVGGAARFDRIGANILPTNDPNVLVVDGTFAWSRNPMYLGFLLMCVGAAVLVGTLGTSVGPALFFAVADRWYIPFEERKMTNVFGDRYLRYRQDVRRWFGRRRETATS